MSVALSLRSVTGASSSTRRSARSRRQLLKVKEPSSLGAASFEQFGVWCSEEIVIPNTDDYSGLVSWMALRGGRRPEQSWERCEASNSASLK